MSLKRILTNFLLKTENLEGILLINYTKYSTFKDLILHFKEDNKQKFTVNYLLDLISQNKQILLEDCNFSAIKKEVQETLEVESKTFFTDVQKRLVFV
jgi:hypothetical protein